MNIKIKSYIVGYNYDTDKVEIYSNESDASRSCNTWCTIEAEDRKEAKSLFIEKYKPVIEE